MRSIWTGSISFGLINIPIKLFSAVQESTLDLDMLDSKDHSNIKFLRVNESTGKEVAYENIVNEQEIDSLYYEQPYYLEPEESAMKAYALLRDALQLSGKVGVTTFVLRNKEGLAILKPYKNVIVLNRIRFSQEIKEPSELKLPAVSKTKTREMDMANKLIDQLTEKFNIGNYKDTYTAKLLKIIKEKSRGKKISVPKMKVVHRKNDNLMDMLKASLSTKKSKSA